MGMDDDMELCLNMSKTFAAGSSNCEGGGGSYGEKTENSLKSK